MNALSAYRLMWLLVMFDLPVTTASERKEATGFHNHLLDFGFEMSQFSVYLRFCSGHSQVETYCKKIEEVLPKGGRVNIVQMTDKQYERIISYRGIAKQAANKMPDQFCLF